MPADDRLRLVLCWHMHQPQYRDLARGDYRLPWTYLHAIKDYTDMAAHLKAHPAARAVVNFAPVLLEQLEDYAGQIRAFLEGGARLRDPMLAALVAPDPPADNEARAALIRDCLRANEARLIEPFPPYRGLARMARCVLEDPAGAAYLDAQFFADLVVWHHLAWLGETVRRGDTRVRRLLARERGYTLAERRELLTIVGELIAGAVARYRALARAGRIELSLTPWGHPILPLLLDPGVARAALPRAPLPALASYPEGEARSRWHVERARDDFRRRFGADARGCWPAEGGISDAALALLARQGFAWSAGGEGVLRRTLARAGRDPRGEKDAWLYRRYRGPGGMSVFFRDDALSDLIGFTYATWHADDAVGDFVHGLEGIAERARGYPERVVSVILDGENAWEHYPANAWYFLDALYARLANHPAIALSTFADCLDLPPAELPPVVAGSWVDGTFSTWIGSRDKNRAWDMLGDAARAFAGRRASLAPEARARAEEQLAVCEGSDWFWWAGDDNPTEAVRDFEALFRLHLTNLYRLLDLEPPAYLAQPFTHGRGAPAHGGTMRPSQET